MFNRLERLQLPSREPVPTLLVFLLEMECLLWVARRLRFTLLRRVFHGLPYFLRPNALHSIIMRSEMHSKAQDANNRYCSQFHHLGCHQR